MNFSVDDLPVLSPDPRRSGRTRARCRAVLEKRRAVLDMRHERRSPGLEVWALGGVSAVYFAALVLNALRLYSSR